MGLTWDFLQDNIRGDALASHFQVILTARRAATTKSPKKIVAGDCRIFICVEAGVLWEFPSHVQKPPAAAPRAGSPCAHRPLQPLENLPLTMAPVSLK